MKNKVQTVILILVILLVLIPTGVIAKNYVMDRYTVLASEGLVAYSVAGLYEVPVEEKTPTPIQTTCTKCKGTKKVKSGDGILVIPCECGENCKCEKTPKEAPVRPVVTLLYFGGKKCSPCIQMRQTTFKGLERTGWTFGPGKNIEILEDRLDGPRFTEYIVDTIPCVIRLEDGKETKRYVGYVNASAFGRVWEGKELVQGDTVYTVYK